MRKGTRRLLTAAIGLVMLFCATQTAFADGPDLSAGNTIKLLASQTEYGADFIRAGLQADFYLVAPAVAEGFNTYDLQVADGYAGITMPGGTATVQDTLAARVRQADAKYDDVADALAAAVLADSWTGTPDVTADCSGIDPDEDFQILASSLSPGMYLVIPHGSGSYVKTVTLNPGTTEEKTVTRTTAHYGVYEYIFQPMLVTVPERLGADGKPLSNTYIPDASTEDQAAPDSGSWRNSAEIYLKAERELYLGDLKIVKSLNPTGPDKASFVFEISWTDNTGAAPVNRIRYATITVNGGGTGGEYTLEKTIPVGTIVTVTEMSTGLQFSAETTTQTATIVASTAGNAPATVRFTNNHDGPGGGHGVVNRFQNEHGPYLWTAYEDSNAAAVPAFEPLAAAGAGTR